MKAQYFQHQLKFKNPAGTSRGILNTKETWFIVLQDDNKIGIGECGLLRGLSCDDRPDYEQKLAWTCQNIHLGFATLWEELKEFPSIQMGLETAFLSLSESNPYELFPSSFTRGIDSIPINGLVWMGNPEMMLEQIQDKIEKGFHCIKLKIAAIDFAKELELIQFIRSHYSKDQIEIRVDANGGFEIAEAEYKLNQFSKFDIHSIEQPIEAGNWNVMSHLCRVSPIPIALDEELIGINDFDQRANLLEAIKPQYLIFKPSFIGGFKGTQHWIDLCEKHQIGWWNTSALESNIGLNAIAQWTYTLDNDLPQGLGTGALYTNNIDSPLEVKNGNLIYNPKINWGDFNF